MLLTEMNNQLLPIISEIYEASYRPDHWSVVLEMLAKLTQSMSSMFIFDYHSKAISNQIMSINLSFGIEDKWVQAYNDYYGSIDPSLKMADKNTPLGVASAEHQNFPDRTFIEQHELYTGFMKPQGMYHTAGLILFHDDSRLSALAIQRTREVGRYENGILQLISDLAPHFQRSLRIHTEFTRLRTREQALYASFDKLALGTVLFDSMGQVIYVNPVAKSIFEYHPAITLKHGNVVTHNSKQGIHLHRAIIDAVNSSPDHIDQKSFAMGLYQPNSDAPLPVLVTPARNNGLLEYLDNEPAHAVMFLSDPVHKQSIAPDVLQQTYGLTEREAEIAVGLCNGLNAEEISQLYAISYHTVRTHMRAVFDKAGVKSHPQLVKLLLSGPYGMAS